VVFHGCGMRYTASLMYSVPLQDRPLNQFIIPVRRTTQPSNARDNVLRVVSIIA